MLIPFATTTLGTYPTYPAAAFLYGLVLTLCATLYNMILLHLVRIDALEPDVDRRAVAATVRGYRTGLFVYAGATLVALVAPVVSFGAYLAIVVYFLVPRGADSDTPLSARHW